MWQVSIFFSGVWWGIGPNYNTREAAQRYIADWLYTYGCNSSHIPFRVDLVFKE